MPDQDLVKMTGKFAREGSDSIVLCIGPVGTACGRNLDVNILRRTDVMASPPRQTCTCLIQDAAVERKNQ